MLSDAVLKEFNELEKYLCRENDPAKLIFVLTRIAALLDIIERRTGYIQRQGEKVNHVPTIQ